MPYPPRQRGGYRPRLISGAVADTAVGRYIHRIIIATAGDAGSTVALYNGAVSGTAFCVLAGTATGNHEVNAWCPADAHIVTVNANGAMRVTVLAE